jgi:hypothetical protein
MSPILRGNEGHLGQKGMGMKTESINLVLLGVAVALLAVLVFRTGAQQKGGVLVPDAQAAEMGASGGMIALLNAERGDLFVVDTTNRRLLAYEYDRGDGEMLLKSARDMQYDLQLRDLSSDKGGTIDNVRDFLRRRGD